MEGVQRPRSSLSEAKCEINGKVSSYKGPVPQTHLVTCTCKHIGPPRWC